jgi:hypothetical protein
MTREQLIAGVLVVSTLVAVLLTIKLWRSNDHILFKVILPFVGLIPIIGPLVMIWVGSFPTRVPWAFRDNQRYSTDVFDRWNSVHQIKDPKARAYAWKAVADRGVRDEPPGGSSPLG